MPWKAFAFTWGSLCALLVVGSLARIASRTFFDPDDFMRLVQVRDLVAGQGWFDLTQYRLDPPGGTPMHWSRLVDAPLALVILALRPLLGGAGAETAALIIVPLLTMGCIVGCAMRIAARFFDTETAIMAGLCAALVPATLAQIGPLRIDHHGWQIACVMLAAVAPLITANARRAGALAGLAMAMGLTISIEVLPLAATYAGILALGWIIRPQLGQRFAAYTGALAISLAVLFLLTRGPAALAPWCDTVAPAHLAFFAAAAALSGLAAAFGPANRWFVLLALALGGLAGLAAFAAIAPNCLGDPFGNLDPLVRKYWYNNISEGMPVWEQTLAVALASGVPVLLAALALIGVRRSADPQDRQFWDEYAILFLAALATGVMVWRSIAFAGALGAVPLGWLLGRVLIWGRQDNARPGKLPLRYLSLAAIIAVLGVLTIGPRKTEPGTRAPVTKLSSGDSECGFPPAAALLNRLPVQTILAPLDISPTLLERSHHAVVASSHHRANLAIRDVIDAFLSDSAQAQAIVTRHQAGLVVFCTDLTEPQNYAHMAPNGLIAQLLAGRIPDWLEPVDVGGPKALKVFRVVGAANRP